MAELLARHDLAWLASDGAARAKVRRPIAIDEPEALRLLDGWIARDRPLIVTRQPEEAEARGFIALGLALPPRFDKHRLPFLVPAACVRETAPPPLLASVVSALPLAWRPLAAALLSHDDLGAAEVRVLGSAGMQAVTGEPCLDVESDLDLQVQPRSGRAALSAVAALAAIGKAIPRPRLDGEVLAPDGHAVAWRELAAASRQVLVKALRCVALQPAAAFLERFGP